MNGAVSRARLGINRWLAPCPLFGYYFALVWGTITPIARPGKPQFSSGRIFTERSNPTPSIGESVNSRSLAAPCGAPNALFTAVIYGDNREKFGTPESSLHGKRI